METLTSIFKLAAGVGLFLFAMYLVEESLKNLSGRNFKLFIQRTTKNNISAVIGGILITCVLQSSSIVSLMVLAFVGAGVFNMRNAMAIILGANLGTTLSNWLLFILGFKTNIEVIAYPALCLGGFLLILLRNSKTIKHISYLLLGFGLLFVGLAFIKTAMINNVQNFDFSGYASMPLLFFLITGFIITVIIQSSSVTMAITLSALNAGAINFPIAAAIVLGSETGTLIKILLSAVGGNSSKKRVALANLFFNIFMTTFTFILLKPMLLLITDILNIKDPLIGLVTFSSLINLFAIIIFLPFLNLFAKFSERFFQNSNGETVAFIDHASINEPKTALDLFKRETKYFIHNSMLFNLELLNINIPSLRENSDYKIINEKKGFISKTKEEKYKFLKQLQGELQFFYLELRKKLEGEQQAELNQLISAARSSMHAVKSMKDIETNITNLKNSSKDIKYNFFIQHKKEIENLYFQMDTFLSKDKKTSLEELQTTFNLIQNNYSLALNNFYTEAQNIPIQDIDITTIINFNRELFTSNKAMLMAIKEILLDEKQAEYFNEIPVYKT